MKISKMMAELKKIRSKHGDLKIVGGYNDDTPPTRIMVINEKGGEYKPEEGGSPAGVFIE